MWQTQPSVPPVPIQKPGVMMGQRMRSKYEKGLLKNSPVKLDTRQRGAVERGVRETCAIRKWLPWAFNIRTNHVHIVVSANCRPEPILSALKANATRAMREAGCWQSERTPWVYRGSKKYLWTEKQLNDAIAYVLYDQGEPLPEHELQNCDR